MHKKLELILNFVDTIYPSRVLLLNQMNESKKKTLLGSSIAILTALNFS